MLYRILTVRKHKTVTFCDAYSYTNFRQQLAFFHDIVDSSSLVAGCTADLLCHLGTNRQGNAIMIVDDILYIVIPNNSTSYKGFQKNAVFSDPVLSILAQDLNGGIHLRQYRFRLMFLHMLRDLLQSFGFYETNTPITNAYRGTSTASPVRAEGIYTGIRYIKITHELGLKMQCCVSLAPVYEIGYVMRDRYTTRTGLNEFLTLEAVLPSNHPFDLSRFYEKVLELSIALAKELNLTYNPVFNSITRLNLKQAYTDKHKIFNVLDYCSFCSTQTKDIPHCIVSGLPNDSPFGFVDSDGIAVETKWMLDGHGLGHGYSDEYRFDNLREAFLRQQNQLLASDINAELPEDFLKVMSYAAIPTFSFNFGIERFIDCFFGKQLA